MNFVECFIYYHLFLKHYLKEQLHPKGFFIVPSKMILFKDVRKSSIRALDWYFIDTFTYTLSKHICILYCIVLLLVTSFYVNGNVTVIRNATQVLIAITALTFILPVYYLYILIRLAVLVYITRIAFIIHNMLVIRDWVM